MKRPKESLSTNLLGYPLPSSSLLKLLNVSIFSNSIVEISGKSSKILLKISSFLGSGF